MFLINSCSGLVSVAVNRSGSKFHHRRQHHRLPKLRYHFALVPSAEFSQALWSTRPDHLCRFRVRFHHVTRSRLFLEVWYQPLRCTSTAYCSSQHRAPPSLPKMCLLPPFTWTTNARRLTFSVLSSHYCRMLEY